METVLPVGLLAHHSRRPWRYRETNSFSLCLSIAADHEYMQITSRTTLSESILGAARWTFAFDRRTQLFGDSDFEHLRNKLLEKSNDSFSIHWSPLLGIGELLACSHAIRKIGSLVGRNMAYRSTKSVVYILGMIVEYRLGRVVYTRTQIAALGRSSR